MLTTTPHTARKARAIALLAAVAAAVAACGGGGGTTGTAGVAASPDLATAAAAPALAASASALFIDTARIPTGSPGFAVDMIGPTTEMPASSTEGDFRTICDYSHMSFDDPIVFPGRPGMSHLHAFFGNTGTDAASTSQSLHTTGNSTCRGGTINRSAYWQPAIIDTKDGSPVKPRIAIVYYKTGNLWIVPATVQALPAGLRMISGDSTATAPSASGAAQFNCGGIAGPVTNLLDPLGPHSIPNCPVGSEVWASVVFPQCWDGVNLDSPDHRSHVAYSNPTCSDPGFPVTLPIITITAVYPVTEKDSPLRWRLASDTHDLGQPGGYSLHADWFNGWKPEIMDAWIKNCDQASKDCAAHLLGDGRMMTW